MKTFSSLECRKIKINLASCKPIWSISSYAHAGLTIAVNLYLQELLVSFVATPGYPELFNL